MSETQRKSFSNYRDNWRYKEQLKPVASVLTLGKSTQAHSLMLTLWRDSWRRFHLNWKTNVRRQVA